MIRFLERLSNWMTHIGIVMIFLVTIPVLAILLFGFSPIGIIVAVLSLGKGFEKMMP